MPPGLRPLPARFAVIGIRSRTLFPLQSNGLPDGYGWLSE